MKSHVDQDTETAFLKTKNTSENANVHPVDARSNSLLHIKITRISDKCNRQQTHHMQQSLF